MQFEEITDLEIQNETAFESVESDSDLEIQEDPEEDEDEVVEEESSEEESEESEEA